MGAVLRCGMTGVRGACGCVAYTAISFQCRVLLWAITCKAQRKPVSFVSVAGCIALCIVTSAK